MKTYWSLNESVLWQTLYTLVDLERLRSVDCGWFHCGTFFFCVILCQFVALQTSCLCTVKVDQKSRTTLMVYSGTRIIPTFDLKRQRTSSITADRNISYPPKNILNNHTEKSVESAYLIYWLFFFVWKIPVYFYLLVLKHEETKQYKNSINVFNNNMEISVFIFVFVSRKRRRGMERLMGLKP